MSKSSTKFVSVPIRLGLISLVLVGLVSRLSLGCVEFVNLWPRPSAYMHDMREVLYQTGMKRRKPEKINKEKGGTTRVFGKSFCVCLCSSII
mgnify:CR=1 FL=1